MNDLQSEHLVEARKALDALAPQMSKAEVGNFVLPQFVGSYQLVLDYARLRMLLAALEAGANEGIVAALAAPSSTASPVVPVAPQQPGNGRIILPSGG